MAKRAHFVGFHRVVGVEAGGASPTAASATQSNFPDSSLVQMLRSAVLHRKIFSYAALAQSKLKLFGCEKASVMMSA